MGTDYGKRIIEHYKIQNDILWDLMLIAQRLCPGGEWVIQLFAHQEYNAKDKRLIKKFMATCTNGDDNVTAVCSNPAAAVSLLIHYLLDGALFPLSGGNGGRKTYPGDNGWKIDGELNEQKFN